MSSSSPSHVEKDSWKDFDSEPLPNWEVSATGNRRQVVLTRRMLPPFPPEIIYEIALYLPLTEDVINLSLTSHAVRRAISTPVLYKARLLLQGWDIDTWQEEDDKAQRSGDWKRWIRIDHIHSKTLQLLEDASAGGLSKVVSQVDFESFSRTPQLRNIGNTLIHFGKAEAWSRRLSEVFPILIARHRVNNISHITETKYYDALRAYMMVVTELDIAMLTHWQKRHKFRSQSSFGLQERACFGLTAFVMQCDAKTIESIFGDFWTGEGTPDFVADIFSRLRPDAITLFRFPNIGGSRTLPHNIGISMQYSVSFLVQMRIRLRLHFEAARRFLTLLPPSIPPMDLASQFDGPYELGSDDISWPWLRDGLAGTPIARLSSSGSGDRWAGYYTSSTMELRDSPMFFKLNLVPPPAVNGDTHKVYFHGEGADSVGPFFLEGSADLQTGVVIARKIYVATRWWSWYGLITPFGMVGVWGIEARAYGWWWIWPEEWSERS